MTISVVSGKGAVKLKVEFSGGLELLFSNRRTYELDIPSQQSDGALTNIDHLVHYLCEHVMTDRRKELFLLNGTVRPGILVLINDADWELEGEAAYVIREGDHIMFVSTLHGG